MPPVSHRKSGVQFSISNRCPVESFSLQSNRCYFDLYAPPQTIARAKIKRNYGQNHAAENLQPAQAFSHVMFTPP